MFCPRRSQSEAALRQTWSIESGHPPSFVIDEAVFHPSEEAICVLLDSLECARPLPVKGLIDNTSNTARILDLGDGRLVKYGTQVSISEAMAMHYVRQNTTIPVPKVHMAFRSGTLSYIVMDIIEGDTLDNAGRTLSEERLHHIAIQLADYICQLSNLEGSRVTRTMGSWPSGPYNNLFFDPRPVREFRFMEEFHAYWIRRLGNSTDLPQTLCAATVQNVRSVLTHGDLSPRNILVRDGQIVGVLDWETFGWYPDFWEYMSAFRGAWLIQWQNALTTVLGERPQMARDYGLILYLVFVHPIYNLP